MHPICRHYVCAICWSPVVEMLTEEGSRFVCGMYRDEHFGLVSQYFVSVRLSRSNEEWLEFKAAVEGTEYGRMMGIPDPRPLQERLERNKHILRGNPDWEV